tara:strand:- start:324 stop:935 length:612 start_codon:yes stop_codon:yes gene_type:complete
MSQHDYVIANQAAPSARADINNALGAIVSQNSGAAEPTSTFANMFWYDSSANILKMRNEADSAWITISTLDQSANTAASPITFASTAEAEGGTNTTKAMSAARVKESIEIRQVFAHLAVGSYALLVNNTTSTAVAGATVAGSTLLQGVLLDSGGRKFGSGSVGGTTVPGQWRCMGSNIRGYYSITDSEETTNYYSAGLFIRTS